MPHFQIFLCQPTTVYPIPLSVYAIIKNYAVFSLQPIPVQLVEFSSNCRCQDRCATSISTALCLLVFMISIPKYMHTRTEHTDSDENATVKQGRGGSV